MKGLSKNTIAWLLFCGSLAAPSAWGFETNYDRGRVDFAGRVTDISCSVALNGGQHAGSGNVWLAPVSLAGSPRSRGRGVYETAAVYPALSNCQLRHDGGAASQDEVRRVSVRWVDGFLLTAVGNENAGYLANTLPDGAQNIYLALSTNDNNTLDKSNKIVPADPQQNQVRLQESAVSGGLFTYYVGYVSPTPSAPPAGRLPAGQRGN